MAKKEKVVDLKPEKISEEQLKNVQQVVNGINRAQLEIGTIELKKHEMLHGISTYKEKLVAMQKEFEKEYGTFDIDIQTGVINYKEDGEADKKD